MPATPGHGINFTLVTAALAAPKVTSSKEDVGIRIGLEVCIDFIRHRVNAKQKESYSPPKDAQIGA